MRPVLIFSHWLLYALITLNYYSILFAIGLLLTTSDAFAQIPRNFGQGNSSNSSEQNEESPESDSTSYAYILTGNINKKIIISDTAADVGYLHKNPMQRDGHELINTGNYGSATYPLIYRPKVYTGFNSGYNQYRAFHISIDNFRFYEQNRPITDIFFSQLSTQENLEVGAAFSRNFSQGLSLSLNYHRISQRGIYTGQDVRATALGIGLRYISPDGKYNAFLIFTHNANDEGNNGGVINEAALDQRFKRAVATKLANARTRQQEREITYIQYYMLSKASSKNFMINLQNTISYKPSYYKFSDNAIRGDDTLFYPGLQIDKRGIRRYTDIQQYSAGFYANGERTKGASGKIGILLDVFTINNSPANFSRTDLTAIFDGKIPIFKEINMESSAKLGLLKNIGNFDLEGKVQLKLPKIGILEGGVRFFRSEVAYNSTTLVINQILQKDTLLTKPIGSSFNIELKIPQIDFSAGIVQNVINNPVFWNENGLPESYRGVFSSSYLRVKQNVKFWKFHLNSQAHFQLLSSKIYPIPSFYSTHQLYYAGKWFKKVMDVNLGLDARFIGDYNGPAYQPLYGEYYQSTNNLPFFPAVNLYFLARVSSFRAMLVMENFSQYFNNKYNFDTAGHPQFDPLLRFGLQWLLKD